MPRGSFSYFMSFLYFFLFFKKKKRNCQKLPLSNRNGLGASFFKAMSS